MNDTRAARLDTLAIVETPEGVVLRLAPVGVVPRALAFAIDQGIVMLFQLLLAAALSPFEGLGAGLLLIAGFFTQWIYPVACEVLWRGQTVGKRTLGLVVVHDDGSPVRLPASAVRNLLLVVDLLFAQAIALACMLSTRRFQRIGDMVAGTMVLHVEQAAAVGAPTDVEPLALPVRLTQEEQRLLVAFTERAPHLSMARQRELADLLQPLHGLPAVPVSDPAADAAVHRLRAYAAGILGPA